MSTTITREILEGFLKCRTKAYLQLRGNHGTRSDYDLLQSQLRECVRREAIKRIQAAHTEGEVLRDHVTTISVLKKGIAFLLDARIEISPLRFLVDGLKKTPGTFRWENSITSRCCTTRARKYDRTRNSSLPSLGM